MFCIFTISIIEYKVQKLFDFPYFRFRLFWCKNFSPWSSHLIFCIWFLNLSVVYFSNFLCKFLQCLLSVWKFSSLWKFLSLYLSQGILIFSSKVQFFRKGYSIVFLLQDFGYSSQSVVLVIFISIYGISITDLDIFRWDYILSHRIGFTVFADCVNWEHWSEIT